MQKLKRMDCLKSYYNHYNNVLASSPGSPVISPGALFSHALKRLGSLGTRLIIIPGIIIPLKRTFTSTASLGGVSHKPFSVCSLIMHAVPSAGTLMQVRLVMFIIVWFVQPGHDVPIVNRALVLQMPAPCVSSHLMNISPCSVTAALTIVGKSGDQEKKL